MVGPEPELLSAGPRPVDRRVLLVLGVAVLVVALVLGGITAVARFRGGASSPVDVGERLVTALEHEDVPALVRLVEPGERAALLRLVGAWLRRLGELDLPAAVGGGAPVPDADALDGLDLHLTGAAPRVESQAGDLAVVGVGDVTVRMRSTPGTARGLLRLWFAHRHVDEPQDQTFGVSALPQVGALPRVVAVQRSGRWYLSVVATLLGPAVGEGTTPSLPALAATTSPTPQAAVEATLHALVDAAVQGDLPALARTLDASGADSAALWSAEVATSGLDRSPATLDRLRTTGEAPDGDRAQVHVDSLRVGAPRAGTGFVVDGSCVTAGDERGCLHRSGYAYAGGIGSLRLLELLGQDGSFSLTAVRGTRGWLTSVPESLADALAAYADGLTRQQVLMVLGQERLDTPAGVLEVDQPRDVAFGDAGYALLTVRIAERGLVRVMPGPDGSNRASVYGPDGQPSVQPFFPNDSVYRVTPGDHTLLVYADDAFAGTLRGPAGAPYVQRVEVRSVR